MPGDGELEANVKPATAGRGIVLGAFDMTSPGAEPSARGAAGARLRLLGPFALTSTAQTRIANRRARGVLAYLALAPGKEATRERLYGLFWGDRAEAQARASLRQCLFDLRRVLAASGLDVLEIHRDRVSLRAGGLTTDVDDLQAAFAADDDRAILEALSQAGRGQLLEGLELRGLYQDWLDQQRARTDQAIAAGVRDCLARLERSGRWADVQMIVDAYLLRDPLDEAIAAAAIRADMALGAAASARRRYDSLKASLARELGVAPSTVVEQAFAHAARGERSATAAGDAGASHPAAETATGVAGLVATAPPGERRHLTILSCGLVDVAELAASLDPEHWHAIAAGFQQRIAAAVEPFGGRVGKILPDGLLVYFGYPQAREDAAERAVHAGLSILESMREFNGGHSWELQRPLQVQLGVHAGTVVVAPDGAGALDVFGEAPNLAQAARAAAAPDTLAISAPVHEMVSGRFIVEDLGSLALKGEEGAVRLFRAVRFGLTGGRVFSPRADAPFIGRAAELGLLESRWRRVRDGEGQLVMVTGEAGLGKSRLIDEFRSMIRAEPHLWIDCAGAPLSANTPFHPVVRLLQQGLGWHGEAAPQSHIKRLEAALGPTGLDLAEAVPLVAEMLQLPPPDGYTSLNLAPDEKRARLLAVLTGWVMTVTTAQPLVVVIEDLQWVDASTLELLSMLAVQCATAPLLLLCNARPGFNVVWPSRAHHSSINLGRLAEREVRALVAALAGSSTLPEDAVEHVVDRTDGVPLFVEALTKLIVEQGGDGGRREVPATLLDSLTARLDRLGPAKIVAQAAAVIGREFPFDLLSAACNMSAEALEAPLEALVEAELILARGAPPNATYRFRHALIQDAAYSALLITQKRDLHGRVASALAGHGGEAQPEVLARHWAAAGDAEHALAAWRSAGAAAYSRRAFPEAEAAYREALAVVAGQPKSRARDELELDLARELDRVLLLTRGYAAPERIAAAERARSLAKQAGSTETLMRDEARLWQGVITAGDYAAAAERAERILAMGAGDPDSQTHKLFACNARIQTCFYTGDLLGVERNFAEVSPLIEKTGARQGPGNSIITLGVARLAAWFLGRPYLVAERASRVALLADDSGNPYDVAMRMHFEGVLCGCRNDPSGAKAAGAALRDLAERHGFDYAGALGLATLGWAVANDGEPEKGVLLLRDAVSQLTTMDARVGATLILGFLAEAEALGGDIDAARMAFTDALTSNPQERVFRPDILRRRGELHCRLGETEAAESDLREAIDVARDMSARKLEAVAALPLGRLLVTIGETEQAKALVEPFLFDDSLDGEALESARALVRVA